ncbi:Aldehyde reductase [Mycena sanguinolenta]|uniref:Aldehyde reductase n=1 Tax=Mycena sanguinolenta TaxID=230812 RepID=A0A8H6Z965_9AGAR|nr:Aldehyde reductase [Mycena sanguinolenta]
MTIDPVKIVFGGAAIGPGMWTAFPDEESIEKVLSAARARRLRCHRHGAYLLRLGRLDGKDRCRNALQLSAARHLAAWPPGTSTGENIPQHAKETVERLRVESIDIYYIHMPDPSVDLEDQLKGINAAYAAGYFKRFGLSNFTVEDVQRVYDICRDKGYPLPTVYQGNYNAFSRRPETGAFIPTLRRLGIAFYVYSPITGGLLTKTPQQFRGTGRKMAALRRATPSAGFTTGSTTGLHITRRSRCGRRAAKETGYSKAELAYRWVAFDSIVDSKYGDAIIFGANSYTQIEETMRWLKQGSVGAAAKAKVDEIWKVVEHDAPPHQGIPPRNPIYQH